MKKRDNTTGKFFTESEPNSRNLTVRVPGSMHSQLQTVAGDRLAAWVRDAIAEKLARETCQQEAS